MMISKPIGVSLRPLSAYDWILFDADETLFHFDAFLGLKNMFSKHGVNFTEDDYVAYQKVNKSLWSQFQLGEISADLVKNQRFDIWTKKLSVAADLLNKEYLIAMSEISMPLDGSRDLLELLHGKVKIGIITNGFSDLQYVRLERTGFRKYFDLVVVSEEVGVAKPNKEIFEYALKAMGHPDRKKILMVGDTIDSDILGGKNAGLETCWFNPKKLPIPDNITPTYQVYSLEDLTEELMKEKVNFIRR